MVFAFVDLQVLRSYCRFRHRTLFRFFLPSHLNFNGPPSTTNCWSLIIEVLNLSLFLSYSSKLASSQMLQNLSNMLRPSSGKVYPNSLVGIGIENAGVADGDGGSDKSGLSDLIGDMIMSPDSKIAQRRSISRSNALTASQASQFIDFVPVAMSVLDLEGNILSSNLEFRNIIKVDTRVSSRPNLIDVISVSDADLLFKNIKKMSTTEYVVSESTESYKTKIWHQGKLVLADYTWTLCSDEERKFIIATGKPLVSEVEGNSRGLLQKQYEKAIPSSMSDEQPPSPWHNFISKVESKTKKFIELKEAQLQSKSLTETLETKRIFVRHVSHEIRTPLNVVVSGLDLLSSCDEKFSVDVLDILRDVKISCAVAIDILNDLLTYEKMDSNILTLDKSACDMVEILRRVYNMFRVQAIHSNIAMELLLEPSTIETVIVDADSTKLSQVFRNLISNAIKFTSGGGKVTIKVSVDPVTRLARVDVQDTGPGISKEDRKKLFNEVVQFNPKELQNGQGSGLGLYLSRKIIDMHGGLIGVDNEWEGIGSKFYIALKVSGNLEENTKARKLSFVINNGGDLSSLIMANGVKYRFLVADDAVLVRKIHQRVLSPFCREFVEASDGREAVEKVRESIASNQPFDAILMDSSMPFMNGTTATKLIRELGYTGKIFGITGNAFQSDIDDFKNHGVDEVLIKPVTLDRYGYIIQSISTSSGSVTPITK